MGKEEILTELTQLPNIGKTLAENLMDIGIKSKDEFIAIGAEKAFIRITAIDKGACLNQLFALEGAVQNIRWHSISKPRKDELKSFFNKLER